MLAISVLLLLSGRSVLLVLLGMNVLQALLGIRVLLTLLGSGYCWHCWESGYCWYFWKWYIVGITGSAISGIAVIAGNGLLVGIVVNCWHFTGSIVGIA